MLRRTVTYAVGLVGVLFFVILASATVGPADIGPRAVFAAMANGIVVPTIESGVVWIRPFDLAVSSTSETIVRTIRLPRIILGAIVGFALATAGTVMQGFFRNPMADPSIIGVSTGAAVGAVAFIVFPISFAYGLSVFAFTGALLAGFAVYLIATEGGRTPVTTLLLAGIAIQTFLGAVISYLMLDADDNLAQAVYWLMGHLHASTWGKVRVSLPVVVVLFIILLAYARDLNVLMLGEEDAHTLGIEVERTKRILLAGSSVVTAAAVAVSGVIGFVGLIVPHMMRLVVGPDHRILLPTSALAGAIFLVATDTVARMGPAEMPVGIITAAIGAPFFLYLLRRREVHAL
ncbi:MAG: vitamin B12 ABC transporter permease BtuC [Natronomonas sp.]